MHSTLPSTTNEVPAGMTHENTAVLPLWWSMAVTVAHSKPHVTCEQGMMEVLVVPP